MFLVDVAAYDNYFDQVGSSSDMGVVVSVYSSDGTQITLNSRIESKPGKFQTKAPLGSVGDSEFIGSFPSIVVEPNTPFFVVTEVFFDYTPVLNGFMTTKFMPKTFRVVSVI